MTVEHFEKKYLRDKCIQIWLHDGIVNFNFDEIDLLLMYITLKEMELIEEGKSINKKTFKIHDRMSSFIIEYELN